MVECFELYVWVCFRWFRDTFTAKLRTLGLVATFSQFYWWWYSEAVFHLKHHGWWHLLLIPRLTYWRALDVPRRDDLFSSWACHPHCIRLRNGVLLFIWRRKMSVCDKLLDYSFIVFAQVLHLKWLVWTQCWPSSWFWSSPLRVWNCNTLRILWVLLNCDDNGLHID